MKYSVLFFFATGFLLFSCKQQEQQVSQNDSVTELNAIDGVSSSKIIPKGDTSQNALDWNGVYKGVLPCANCKGIETELSLLLNGTFVLKTKYLGKGSGEINEIKGAFSWDESGSIVVLSGLDYSPNQYKVGENQLFQLDRQGEVVKGDLASLYILKKVE
jgi:uncharacterized lipoprotein NlpE involved in copper resistance